MTQAVGGRASGPRPLRSKLVWRLVIAATVPLVLTAGTYSWFMARHLRRESGERVAEVAGVLATDVRAYLDSHRHAVESLSEQVALVGPRGGERTQAALATLRRRHPGFLTTLVADEQGRIVAADPIIDARGELQFPTDDNVSDREYFRQPLASAEPFVSEVFLGRGWAVQPIVAISAPLRGPEGRVAGVVEGTLDLSRFETFASQFTERHGLDVVILDQAERVVYSTSPATYPALTPLTDLPVLAAARAAAGAGSFEYRAAASAGGPEVTRLAARAAVRVAGGGSWTVLAHQDLDAALLPFRRFVTVIAVALAFVLVAVVVTSWVIARRVTRPLERLVARIREVVLQPVTAAPEAWGDPDILELDELQRDFAAMTARLRKTWDELSRTLADRERLNADLAASHRAVSESARALEERVERRTSELARANRSLQAEVAERLRAEAELRRKNELLASLGRAQLLFIRREDPEQPFVRLLDDVVRLTGSRCGLLAETVGGTFAGRRLLSHACCVDGVTTPAPFAEGHACATQPLEGTLLAHALAGEAVFSTDTAHDPRGGLPAEHGPVSTLMALPVRSARGIVGLIAVGDRPGGYDEALHAELQPLLDTCANLIESHRGERERAQAEGARLLMERKLQESQRLEALGVLAGGIAHDFNNILTAILGNAALAEAEAAPGTIREALHEVVEAAHRAAELCRQMLAYSGQGRVDVQKLGVNEVLLETSKLLQVSIGKKAELRFELAPDLPAVRADATQLRQLVMNLVINASEALGDEPGVVRLRTGVEELSPEATARLRFAAGAAPGLHVFVEVIDAGCGMSAATMDRMFDPFFSTKFTGRGLGLSAVAGIVRGHRGALHVDSAPGRGTTFRVYLPAVEGERAVAPAPAVGPQRRRLAGTVLVVDDEPPVLTLAARILESWGLTVVQARDGREAVASVTAAPDRFRLVLLDSTMPKLGGIEAFHALRALRRDLPIILMSGYDEAHATGRQHLDGLAGFLPKPFSSDELWARVAPALGYEVEAAGKARRPGLS